MTDPGPTWIVLTRDVSNSVQVATHEAVIGTMVLDADTGLVRGLSMGATREQSCVDAMTMALAKPAGPLPPGPPMRVVHGEADADVVAATLDTVLDAASGTAGTAGTAATEAGATSRPELFLAAPIPEAEDIFDSFLSHLAGRRPTDDLPTTEDWESFYDTAAQYCRAAPWQRWSDADSLPLELTVDGELLRYVAVVIGQAGIQRGLALYPGDELPEELQTWEPGEPAPVPEGSLVMWLDPPEDSAPDLVAKARRYAWSEDLVPAPLSVDPDGVGELDPVDLRVLTGAAAAILAHDERRGRPTSVTEARRATQGSVRLGDGATVAYTIG